MKQAESLSSEPTITLTELSAQTGTHKLIAYIPGTGARTAEFDVAAAGVSFSVPNIFPEIGTYEFDITQPDATKVDDGSGCSMWLKMIVHCGADVA